MKCDTTKEVLDWCQLLMCILLQLIHVTQASVTNVILIE